MVKKSLFIVIEGLDGSGKTSVSRLLSTILDSQNHGRVKLTFEPHDPSCAGLFIRQVLMKKIRNFSPRTLALAFATNRLDHCEREINPWLDSSESSIVICDRYYLSSMVYQSDLNHSMGDIFELNATARKPDLIFFLDVSNKICYERMKIRNEAKELFERNLSETRSKYKEAITYLRDHNSDNIVEIDASGSIEEVADLLIAEIYKVLPNLQPHQPSLSTTFATPHFSSLNGHNPYSLDSVVEEFTFLREGLVGSEKSDSVLSTIETKIDLFEFNKLGGLFLDYISYKGIMVGEKLPWTELDAYELEYEMPGNILLKGVGLIIQEKQRYDVIMKKAPDIPRMSDFMFVFSPGPSELVTHYYERDKIQYNTEIKQEGLFPSTQLVTQRDLAKAILEKSIQRQNDPVPEQ